MKSGNPEETIKECEKAIEIAVEAETLALQIEALRAKGCILLELDSINDAQKIADELRELIKNGVNQKSIKLYYHLMGLIERKKGNIYGVILNTSSRQFRKNLISTG